MKIINRWVIGALIITISITALYYLGKASCGLYEFNTCFTTYRDKSTEIIQFSLRGLFVVSILGSIISPAKLLGEVIMGDHK